MPEQDSLYATMGLHRIVELTPEGTAQLEYDARPNMCHSGGVVQGGFVTGWIDAAMAHAAIARAGHEFTPMTLEIKVSFLAPVRPGRVVAEGWAVRHGRKTCFLRRHAQGCRGQCAGEGQQHHDAGRSSPGRGCREGCARPGPDAGIRYPAGRLALRPLRGSSRLPSVRQVGLGAFQQGLGFGQLGLIRRQGILCAGQGVLAVVRSVLALARVVLAASSLTCAASTLA